MLNCYSSVHHNIKPRPKRFDWPVVSLLEQNQFPTKRLRRKKVLEGMLGTGLIKYLIKYNHTTIRWSWTDLPIKSINIPMEQLQTLRHKTLWSEEVGLLSLATTPTAGCCSDTAVKIKDTTDKLLFEPPSWTPTCQDQTSSGLWHTKPSSGVKLFLYSAPMSLVSVCSFQTKILQRFQCRLNSTWVKSKD